MTLREILTVFKAEVCACGKQKKPRMSHCRDCYYALPLEMRQALYSRFSEGYEEAYEASITYLKGKRVINDAIPNQ